MKNRRFDDSMDRALGQLRFEGAQRVMQKARWPGAPRKKPRWMRPLLASALLLSLALGALALGLYSPFYSATRAAKQKLSEQYGLSERALGLFDYWERRQQEDGGWQFRFAPTVGNIEAIGSYTVEVDSRGRASASWTHDGETVAPYSGGPDIESLNAEPVWGASHLEAYFDYRTRLNEELRASLPQEAERAEAAPSPIPESSPAPGPEEARAIDRARQALLARLDISGETLDLLFTAKALSDAVLFEPAEYEDNMLWQNALAGEDPEDHISRRLGSYTVKLPEKEGGQAEILWSLEGIETGSFGDSDWAQAKAYGPELLPRVAELAAMQLEMAAHYPPRTNLDDMDARELAEHDRRFREAGFPLARYSHGLPAEGEMDEAQAEEAARQAIARELGIDGGILKKDSALYGYRLYNHITGQSESTWSWSFTTGGGVYTVIMGAKDGTIYYLEYTPNEAGNG